MSITKIPYSKLSIEAVLELANRCVDIIATKHPEDPLLTVPLTDVDKPLQRAKIAIASSRKKELTEEIGDADFKRDRMFVGFRKYLEAQQFKDWERPVQKAAMSLLSIVEKHGKSLHREGLTVQSALLASLFEELDSEQSKADLETIGAQEWLDRLKKFQEDFSVLIQRRDELESKKDIPTKADAKAELVQKLTVLISGLDFLTNTQATKYGEAGKLVNEVVDRVVLLSQR